MSWEKTKLSTYLGISILFAFAISAGLSILCWECNSEYDRNCADPFNKSPFRLTDCSQRKLSHYPNNTAQWCRKIVQKTTKGYRYIRACGFLKDERTDCYRKAGTFDVQIEYCQCMGRACNGATSVSVTHHLLLPLLASACVLQHWKIFN